MRCAHATWRLSAARVIGHNLMRAERFAHNERAKLEARTLYIRIGKFSRWGTGRTIDSVLSFLVFSARVARSKARGEIVSRIKFFTWFMNARKLRSSTLEVCADMHARKREWISCRASISSSARYLAGDKICDLNGATSLRHARRKTPAI